jgi:peptide/nickel transport system substrate-binding protein
MKHAKAGAVIAAGVLAATLAACSSSSSSPSAASTGNAAGGSSSSTLTIDNESGALWTCTFSPFNEADAFVSAGFVYEPLVYVNPLQSGATTPMLATAWKWSNGNKTLTFDIRQGVKWSNGTPFSAADVVYTFDLIKKYAALDTTGVWSVLTSVAQSGSDQVVFQFSKVAVPYFYYIADQTPIVPESIWSKISNPVSYPDSHPVGTGPYEVNPCSSANITYTANPDYWQAGEPHVKKLEYPAFTSNTTANEYLANGSAQWGGQYIPAIQSYYIDRSAGNHYWFPPTVNVTLIPNLTNSLLSNVKVRQAISYAINRQQVSTIGESGYEPPANQTGIVTPTFSSSEDTSELAQYGNYSYNPSKATSLLKSAGYHMGSGGVMENAAGQQLSFTVINVGGNSDWVADMQVIQQELKAVGIAITADNLTSTDFDADVYTGKFQLAYDDQNTFGPSAYYELNDWLNSANTAPIGQTAATNYERYNNAATTALLNEYATTTSTATQQSIMNQVEGVMLSDVPVIPVVEAVDWYQYNTSTFSGWPTQSDPYAQPAPYQFPDMEQVLLKLAPAK